MKKTVFIYSIIFLTLTGFSQKQLVHVASKANNSCNGDCTLLDIAELNDNPSAIIWVKPVVENGVNLNPHPIGVYYFKSKWRIFNLDQRAIPEGSKFTVEYVDQPDETHFQFTISRNNLQMDGSAIIDHPALNNNSGVQFIYFPSWDPEVKRGTANRELTTIQYNRQLGKWVLNNTNHSSLITGITYNIIISSSVSASIPPTNKTIEIKELIVNPTGSSISTPVEAIFMTAFADGLQLPGDNSLKLSPEKTRVFGFEMGTSRLSQSGRPAKTSYEPVTIKIHTGVPATIPFFKAYAKQQAISLNIDVYSNSSTGRAELNYTISLSGASIVSFRQVFEDAALNSNADNPKKYYDEIKISFSKIEYLKDGVSVEDNL